MNVNDTIEDLKLFEGFRANPYKDTVGKLTIGYGWNLDDCSMREQEAAYRLHNDVQECIARVSVAFPWWAALDPVRQSVLVQMVFQLGLEGVLKFKKFLAAAEIADHTVASAQMMDSLWAKQVPLRAKTLAQRWLTGIRELGP